MPLTPNQKALIIAGASGVISWASYVKFLKDPIKSNTNPWPMESFRANAILPFLKYTSAYPGAYISGQVLGNLVNKLGEPTLSKTNIKKAAMYGMLAYIAFKQLLPQIEKGPVLSSPILSQTPSDSNFTPAKALMFLGAFTMFRASEGKPLDKLFLKSIGCAVGIYALDSGFGDLISIENRTALFNGIAIFTGLNIASGKFFNGVADAGSQAPTETRLAITLPTLPVVAPIAAAKLETGFHATSLARRALDADIISQII